MHLVLPLAVDLSIALVIISSAAALEPTFVDDEPQSIRSGESATYDQGIDVFTDWNKPVPDTGSTLGAMNALNPSDDLCPSDMSDKLPPNGKVRARGAGVVCKPPHTRDGPQKYQPIPPDSAGGIEEEQQEEEPKKNGHHSGSNNNGREADPSENPISPNNEQGTNGNGNKPNAPPTAPSTKDPNEECFEFMEGIFQYAVCDSGRGPDFFDIMRRPHRWLPGWMTFQLEYCFRGTVSLRLVSCLVTFT